jgi:hypothetical protein
MPYFSRSTSRYEDNIKNYVKNIGTAGPCRLDSSGSGYELAVGSWDTVSHLYDSMNELVSDWWLLKDTAPYS